MTISVGDRVGYSAQFLKSTGLTASVDDVGNWKGTVVHVDKTGFLARVIWDHDKADEFRILTKNLAKIGPNTQYCAS